MGASPWSFGTGADLGCSDTRTSQFARCTSIVAESKLGRKGVYRRFKELFTDEQARLLGRAASGLEQRPELPLRDDGTRPPE